MALLIGAWIFGTVHVARQLPEGGLCLALAAASVLGPVVVLPLLILLAFDFSSSRRFATELLRMMGAHTSRARPREWRPWFPEGRRAYLVEHVDPDSKLERAGVQVGDCVVAWSGVPIDRARAQRCDPDRPPSITVVRQGVLLELPLKPNGSDPPDLLPASAGEAPAAGQ